MIYGSFFERLEQRCLAANSLLCVGLDPHRDELPEQTASAARDFCLRLIEVTAEVAAAFKPNSAFFEVYGAGGMRVLKEVIGTVPEDIPVILDAKRGDIPSTSQAYAQAAFQTLGADAITASPYLGRDSIEPFIADSPHGIFLLCKTSNPGASDLQDMIANGEPVYVQVARLAQACNEKDNVGLVVGATFPQVLTELRGQFADLWFLTPGAGAQGGELEAAVAAGLRADELGMLVPISRGISRAARPAQAAREFRDAINATRAVRAKTPRPTFPYARLAQDLLDLGCVQFGKFKLKSGLISPIYLDLRRLVGDPTALARVASAYIELMRPLKFDRIAGLPYAALPLATAISLESGWPLVYPRKEVKDYGTLSAVEGIYQKGERVVVVDDLVTTGGSKLEGIEKLKEAGLKVADIVVLIDRRTKTSALMDGKSLRLHAVFKLPNLLTYWRDSKAISNKQYESVIDFLQEK